MANAEAGWAGLGIIPTFDKFGSELERGSSKAMLAAGHTSGTKFGDAAGRTAGSRFGGVFKKAAAAGLVGIGALGVGAFKLAKDAIGAASDLEESTNKVSQVFGKSADDVFRFSAKAADALGQSNEAARDAAATFGVMGRVAKLSDKENAKFSVSMTKLASDLASFSNTSPEEAIEALGAALRGEAEPIRRYGVLLDDATLKAEAARIGILKPVKDQAKIKSYQVAVLEGQKAYNEAVEEFGPKSLEALKAEAALGSSRDRLNKAVEGTVPTLTAQQKVLAAQSSIMRQTTIQQGDFARTSDGLANQQRRMAARFEDAKAALGKGLLPIMTDAAGWILDHGLPAFEKFSDWFGRTGAPALGDFADEMRPLAKSLLPAAGDALGIIRDGAKGAAPYVKDMVDAFADMPKWAQTLLVGGGAAAFGAKKLGLLGGGRGLGRAGLGAVASKASPVPVLVTNPGFGAGAGGGAAAGGGKRGSAGKVAGGAAAAVGAAYLIDRNQNTESILDKYGYQEGFKVNLELITKGFERIDDLATLTGLVARLPKRVATEVATPGALESIDEVVTLSKKFDLTPREVKTLLRTQDFATKDINAVLKRLDITHKKKTEPKVEVDTRKGLAGLFDFGRELDKATRPRKVIVTAEFSQNLSRQLDRSGHHLAGARAGGGSVFAGKTYKVGERGAELVTFPANGYVTPNHKLSQTSQSVDNSRRTSNEVHYHGDIHVTDGRDLMRRARRALGSAAG